MILCYMLFLSSGQPPVSSWRNHPAASHTSGEVKHTADNGSNFLAVSFELFLFLQMRPAALTWG